LVKIVIFWKTILPKTAVKLSRVMHNFNSLRRAVLKAHSRELKLWITLKNTLWMYAELAFKKGEKQKNTQKNDE